MVAFGKRWGKELKLPRGEQGTGGYFVDWVLALLDARGDLQEFVAVEVQSIDTTGNYRAERDAHLTGEPFAGTSTAGLNWENVSKRILPQLIYKGHVLRRERLCSKGLFFVCPTPVYDRIQMRLGRAMLSYNNLQPGSLTFMWYDAGAPMLPGQIRSLEYGGQFTTTIDQVYIAFGAPTNLPPENVYESAIRTELKSL